jgi:outer membrane lipoprotein-sorting protein
MHTVLLLLVFFSFSAHAASAPLTRDQLAEQLEAYRSIRTLHAHFHETKHLKDLKIDLTSEGELDLERPTRVVWRVTSPSPLTVTLEKDKLSITSDGKREQYEMEGRAKESLKALVAWLELDPDALMANYRVLSLGKDRFRFEPKDTNAPVQSLQMKIRAKGYVERLEIEERSGDSLDIRFDPPRVERSHEK